MTYDEYMDPECIPLCDAINRIPGLSTTSSCCGHGKRTFSVYLCANDMKYLPILLYYIDPCHVGFRWTLTAKTDCCMSPVSFRLESLGMGKEAYEQAATITLALTERLAESIKLIDTGSL